MQKAPSKVGQVCVRDIGRDQGDGTWPPQQDFRQRAKQAHTFGAQAINSCLLELSNESFQV